jgi:hypothetical protein
MKGGKGNQPYDFIWKNLKEGEPVGWKKIKRRLRDNKPLFSFQPEISRTYTSSAFPHSHHIS